MFSLQRETLLLPLKRIKIVLVELKGPTLLFLKTYTATSRLKKKKSLQDINFRIQLYYLSGCIDNLNFILVLTFKFDKREAYQQSIIGWSIEILSPPRNWI